MTGLLTVAELAAALRVSRATVDRWLANGTLTRWGLREANRLGRRRLFDAASVERVLYSRRLGGLRRLA